MDICIKDKEVLRGLMERRYSPILIDIICYVAHKYGFVMTESYREKKHRNDLHGTIPVRANDLREWCYPAGFAKTIKDDINAKWQYDPRRPKTKFCAKIHDVGNGIHFHIQVHPRTRVR